MWRILRQNYENVIIVDYVTDSLRILLSKSTLGLQLRFDPSRAVHVRTDKRGRKEKTFPPLRVTIDSFFSSLDKVFYEISFFVAFFFPSSSREPVNDESEGRDC